ncbi:methyltransferase domain-containing protein [Henriciella sp.]|uniref:class I SAM-dependent methyltransferase n=1 Tax=Henriciella sp. TaxID=1968823 RepID=UPI0026184B4C|nr:methyltransferase domain-containing protein [Henriciella sp.]
MSGPVSDHYNRPDLLTRIEKALGEMELCPETVTLDALAPVEEFHVGGRMATDLLLPELEIREEEHALDVGCGTGGTSRHAAHRYGCHVDGIDLTGNFIETGKAITSWVKLGSLVQLHHESALDMPFKDELFDVAWMFHVGMNIETKRELFAEVFRVLKPGGRFLVYDIMRGEDETTPLTFPVPWAGDPSTSFVRSADRYEEHLEAAGFAISKTEARHDIASRFFEHLDRQAGQPSSPMSLAMVMGETAKEKSANLRANYEAGRIVPTAILCRKPA